MSQHLSHDALREILRFYTEAGVDIALADVPADRFDEARTRVESARNPEPVELAPERRDLSTAPPPLPDKGFSSIALENLAHPPPTGAAAMTLPSAGTVMAAREAADTANSLEELRSILAGFEGCNLRFTATNLVFGDGNPQARVMFVGEAPGLDEDLQGLPFVGRSGQLLDRMLLSIGLDRSSAYIANVVPWRPPGNRKPTPQETEICRPFIERQITLVDPDSLVLLGDASAKQLLKTTTNIGKLRGRWQSYRTGNREIRALPTFHPAYLLRSPGSKRLAWRDLLALKAELGMQSRKPLTRAQPV